MLNFTSKPCSLGFCYAIQSLKKSSDLDNGEAKYVFGAVLDAVIDAVTTGYGERFLLHEY